MAEMETNDQSDTITLCGITYGKYYEIISWLKDNIEDLGSDPKLNWPIYGKNYEWSIRHLKLYGIVDASIKFKTLRNVTLFKLRFG